jgi:murein DD-endopeptidase MepM/ murein hydrolase activator NlpD
MPGHKWTLTGGPHYAWFPDAGSLAALDLAPPADAPGCQVPDEFVTAVGPGVVTRSERGVVAVDMDGDGYEETGWTIFYLHIADGDKVKVGDRVNTNDPIGHPSCFGGDATGVHVHIARKFNGEWMAADGPVPFVMSGWRAYNGPQPYLGKLVRGSQVATANQNIQAGALVNRPKSSDADSTPTPGVIITPTAQP